MKSEKLYLWCTPVSYNYNSVFLAIIFIFVMQCTKIICWAELLGHQNHPNHQNKFCNYLEKAFRRGERVQNSVHTTERQSQSRRQVWLTQARAALEARPADADQTWNQHLSNQSNKFLCSYFLTLFASYQLLHKFLTHFASFARKWRSLSICFYHSFVVLSNKWSNLMTIYAISMQYMRRFSA